MLRRGRSHIPYYRLSLRLFVSCQLAYAFPDTGRMLRPELFVVFVQRLLILTLLPPLLVLFSLNQSEHFCCLLLNLYHLLVQILRINLLPQGWSRFCHISLVYLADLHLTRPRIIQIHVLLFVIALLRMLLEWLDYRINTRFRLIICSQMNRVRRLLEPRVTPVWLDDVRYRIVVFSVSTETFCII